MEVASDGGVSFQTCDRRNLRQYFYPNLTSGQIVSHDDPTKCLDDGGWSPYNYPPPTFQPCNATSPDQYWNATVKGKADRG